MTNKLPFCHYKISVLFILLLLGHLSFLPFSAVVSRNEIKYSNSYSSFVIIDFSHIGFGIGFYSLVLFAPFPGHCLFLPLVLFAQITDHCLPFPLNGFMQVKHIIILIMDLAQFRHTVTFRLSCYTLSDTSTNLRYFRLVVGSIVVLGMTLVLPCQLLQRRGRMLY